MKPDEVAETAVTLEAADNSAAAQEIYRRILTMGCQKRRRGKG